MTPIVLHLSYRPRAWQRARSRGSQRYTPKPVREAKDAIALQAKSQMPTEVLYHPLKVSMVFRYATKAKKQGWRQGVPDLDNLAKLVMDALNRIVWWDDAQIVQLSLAKIYGSPEGCSVVVEQPDEPVMWAKAYHDEVGGG